METVNIHDAKTHLSRLVDRAAKGEPFVIARAGRPLVKVVPLDEPVDRKPSRFGFLKDAGLKIREDFDRLAADEIQAMFEGGEEIILAHGGKQIARLTAIASPRRRAIRFGVLKDKVSVAPDFDAPLPAEVLAGFEGT